MELTRSPAHFRRECRWYCDFDYAQFAVTVNYTIANGAHVIDGESARGSPDGSALLPQAVQAALFAERVGRAWEPSAQALPGGELRRRPPRDKSPC